MNDSTTAAQHDSTVSIPLVALGLLAACAGLAIIAYAAPLEWLVVSAKSASGELEVTTAIDGTGQVRAQSTADGELVEGSYELETAQVPGGHWIRGLSLTIAGLVGLLVIGLFTPLLTRLPQQLVLATIYTLLATALLSLIWFVGWIYQTVSLSQEMTAAVAGKTSHLGVINWSTQQAPAVYFGIGGSALAAWAFAFVAARFKPTRWIHAVEFAGALIGVSLVATVLKPWEADELWVEIRDLPPYERFDKPSDELPPPSKELEDFIAQQKAEVAKRERELALERERLLEETGSLARYEPLLKRNADGEITSISFRQFGHARSKINDADFSKLDTFTALESLDLAETSITDETLSRLANLTALRELKLANTKISDDGLQHVTGLANLISLELSRTSISDAGMLHLAGLSSLEDLRLSYTHVGDTGISRLVELPQLQTLDLSSSQISDEGLKSIAQFKQLINLNLSRNPITDVGVKELAGLTNIEILSLISTLVSDQSIELLSELPKLRAVDLMATRVTDEGRQKLWDALPSFPRR